MCPLSPPLVVSNEQANQIPFTTTSQSPHPYLDTGEVYRCLIYHHDDLDPGCKKELGRAVHMAFFIWSPAAILTSTCDADVAMLCLKQRPNMDAVPGAVGSCLAEIVSAWGGFVLVWAVGILFSTHHSLHVC